MFDSEANRFWVRVFETNRTFLRMLSSLVFVSILLRLASFSFLLLLIFLFLLNENVVI